MRQFRFVPPIALVLALTLFGGGRATAADPAAGFLGKPAPSFRLVDVRSGNTFSLEDMRGRIVVLHFGASW